MLTTAKNMQLLDASGINISPMTDITSLYYEVESKLGIINSSIITRKFIYSGFPVSVQFDDNVISDISVNYIYDSSYTPVLGHPFYKIKNIDNSDIIVSNVSTNIIPGTTYRLINISNFNLTNILYNYATREMVDTSISKIDTSLHYNEDRINDLYSLITVELFSLSQILSNPAIPDKFYLINDYYSGIHGGCMDYSPTYYGSDYNDRKLLLVKKCNGRLDGILYGMYNANGSTMYGSDGPVNVHGNYIIVEKGNRKYIRIINVKDSLNNECKYDFYNIKFPYNDLWYYTFSKDGRNAWDETTIVNNIINIDPYNTSNRFICIVPDNGGYIYLENNIIENSSITLIVTMEGCGIDLTRNVIENNNNIHINTNTNDIYLYNLVIGNNNTLQYNKSAFTIRNIMIGNENKIIFDTNLTDNINLNSFVVGSKNEITITNGGTYNNIIIKNNCKSKIKFVDNLILDNYQSSDVFEPNSNSAYLFEEDMYAKSFNTFR